MRIHAIPTGFLPQRSAKNTETKTYGVLSLRSLRSLWSLLFWLRLAALSCLALFAANQWKHLSINNLHLKLRFFRSNPVKDNQGKLSQIKPLFSYDHEPLSRSRLPASSIHPRQIAKAKLFATATAWIDPGERWGLDFYILINEPAVVY